MGRRTEDIDEPGGRTKRGQRRTGINVLIGRLWKKSEFREVLRRFLRACTPSANSADLRTSNSEAPKTVEKLCPRAETSGGARRRRGFRRAAASGLKPLRRRAPGDDLGGVISVENRLRALLFIRIEGMYSWRNRFSRIRALLTECRALYTGTFGTGRHGRAQRCPFGRNKSYRLGPSRISVRRPVLIDICTSFERHTDLF